MRLLVITQYFWPEDFRINELVSELIRRGHEVTVLTGKPNYPDGKVFPEFVERPDRFSTYFGAHVLRVPMLSRGRGRVSLFLNYLSYALSTTVFGILRLQGKQFDAIFVFEPSPITVGLPAIALRRLRRWPVAFWVLDQWPEALSAMGVVKSRVGLALAARLVSFIYSRCDLILAPSKSLVSRIGSYCRDQRRIVYFPNWAESVYSDTAAVPATEIPIGVASFTVMFAGNIGEAQDFPAILDAAEQLKNNSDIRWIVVGDGRLTGWVKDEVNRRGLQERFILLGRFPLHRMPSLYKHASALLVSLKSDTILSMMIPGKAQSYLAFGLPLIGMLDGEGARVIEEADAGLTCPAGESGILAEIVLRMAGMTERERSAMGANGRAYAKREFDRDLLVNRLEGLLAKLSISHGKSVEA